MLSKTLSSTGSGLSAQRFLKLFFMASSFLLIYLPVTLYFFYLNLPIPFTPYSWSRLHAPESWDPIVFYTTATFPRTQYNGWVGVAMGFLCFIFYGMNNEAIDIYKSWSIKLGFATLFPRLLQPREIERRGSSSSGTAKASWTHHFDLVSKTLHYLDGSRKSSQTSSISTIS
jgi:pheromone a factor receptor